ncbi:hopanoid biosynthesis-associated protein HpnK [Candidatus Nitrosacidococcus sp. I8]|uniref:hopanoid biosynthesis-associated protein HpnK n=1 Tax=Candidatus Nitrosacidococcus sp. I8 TaxID=2942908 RepID=UPI00222791AD|nr:hopanoid biosynthesis-associated protein HpnK [Candidatus Nitrosacidococcus sp. I8]CAH9018166.1 Carbohydrate deacetylase [Candidatus Nitrosacidococcus sp. I8]
MKQLIITGDDFGLCSSVNEAIEQAHCQGILTTASLMMGESGTQNAIDRAHRLSTLKIGLHITVVDGTPVLPPQMIPDLIGENGRFRSQLFGSGVRFYFIPKVQKQLEDEIRAQFKAFAATGLSLDHVNSHHHMHLHPTVLQIILKVGQEFGVRAIRLPYEPIFTVSNLFLGLWVHFMTHQLRKNNILNNQFIFGLKNTGKIDTAQILQIINNLPEGVSELYTHPDLNISGNSSSGFLELCTLTSLEVKESLRSQQIKIITFSDLSTNN